MCACVCVAPQDHATRAAPLAPANANPPQVIKKVANKKRAVAGVHQEVAFLRRLSHPHVVKVRGRVTGLVYGIR